MICADQFSGFSYEMRRSQYYPPSAPELSENRLFGMFHASTPQHSKDVIMGSLQDCHGTVRVVFVAARHTQKRQLEEQAAAPPPRAS